MAELQRIFEESVHLRMVADVPVQQKYSCGSGIELQQASEPSAPANTLMCAAKKSLHGNELRQLRRCTRWKAHHDAVAVRWSPKPSRPKATSSSYTTSSTNCSAKCRSGNSITRSSWRNSHVSNSLGMCCCIRPGLSAIRPLTKVMEDRATIKRRASLDKMNRICELETAKMFFRQLQATLAEKSSSGGP